MLKIFSDFNRAPKILLTSSGLVLAIVWFITILRWRLAPEFIPLHYTVYFGFDRFGPKSDIFLFAVIGTVVWFVNSAVTKMLFKENNAWQIIFLGLTLFLELVLLAALFLVISYGFFFSFSDN